MPIVLESRKENYDEGGWLNFSRGQISTYKLSEWGGEISI